MAVAAAGGGLLITAASAVRAGASASGSRRTGPAGVSCLYGGDGGDPAPRRWAARQAPGPPFQRRFSGPA